MVILKRNPVIRSLLVDEMLSLLVSSIVSIDDVINELGYRKTRKAKNMLGKVNRFASNSLYIEEIPEAALNKLTPMEQAFLIRNNIHDFVALFNIDFLAFKDIEDIRHIHAIKDFKNAILSNLLSSKTDSSFTKAPRKLNITPTKIDFSFTKAPRKSNITSTANQNEYLISEVLNSSLNTTNENIFFKELSVRTTNCLKKGGIKKYSQLTVMTSRDLLKLPDFGQKSLREIISHLEEINQLMENDKELPDREFIFSSITESVTHNVIFLESLSMRTRNSLNASRISTYSQVKKMSEEDFLKLPNFGRKSLAELKNHMSAINQALLIKKPLSPEQLMQKKRERFLNQTRNGRQIIELWNNSHETLNSIAKSLKPPITRERVRQILKKANEMGIVVMSKLEKSKKKRDHSLSLILNQHQSEFMKLYNLGHANTNIMQSIGISDRELKLLKKYLLDNGLIDHRLARTSKEKKNPGIEKRRQMILTLINNNTSNKNIALILGISIPTLLNDKNEMRKSGMPIPPAMTIGKRIDSDEINYRTYFIEDKISKGWSKERISKALGFKDSGSVSRHIKKYML